ncbi:MAG: ABC transporter permease, partial [Pirellulales bacterium]|nr:ABC transporter permease [Pirellulales bacterium]
MLVWLVGSIGLVVLQFENEGEKYLGHYHVAMIPQRGDEPAAGAARPMPPMAPPAPLLVEPKVLDELRSNDLVMQVSPARQIRGSFGKYTMAKYTDKNSVLRRQRAGHGTPMGSPTIVGIDADQPPFELEEGDWFDASSDQMQGVMGTAAARSLGIWGQKEEPVRVGDDVAVRLNEKEYKIKIVGLVDQKAGGGFGFGGGISPVVSAVYVSMATAEKIQPRSEADKGKAQYLYVRLRDGANVAQFKQSWSEHLASEGIQMEFMDAADIQESFNHRGGPRGGGLMGRASSMSAIILFTTLVSTLIVFTALSMGVGERSRVFAMMRTVGMQRWHIVVLIFGESMILCVLGWIVGMTAGWLVLQATVWLQPDVFGSGKTVSLDASSIITSGVAAFLGAMLAAIIPAWRGAKVSPLEGMNRGYVYNVKKRWFYLFGIVGGAMLIVNPLVIYYGVSAETSLLRLALYTYVGLPTQILGLVLLTPTVVLLVERFLSAPVAKMLFIEKSLLKNQLSANLWRTLGTTVALTIGLGVYSFLEISGYSMLVPFTHSQRLPNTLVACLPKGLPLDRIAAVRNLDGVDRDKFLPMALEQPLFSTRQAKQFSEFGMSPMQAGAGVVVFGLDVARAFEPRDLGVDGRNRTRLVDVDLVEGTWDDALAKLKSGGRYCIIPDSFAFRARLHVGDKLELMKPKPGERGMRGPGGRMRRRGPGRPGEGPSGDHAKPIEYEVCGVASVPGWLWMAKLSGVRKYGYRSGSLMFAPYKTVQDDFKLSDAAYFWFDRTLDASGGPTVSDADLERSLQKLLDEEARLDDGGGAISRPMVKVSSHKYLNDRVGSRGDSVIQAAARLPLILLMISSLGMMGTVAASIRTRRFELGMLRCLGITRFGLVRLILAEALLIALSAVIISIVFGILGAWCFVGLMRYVSFFGGFLSPLTIPWYYLSLGFAATLLLCGLAALFPAIVAGRKHPADLVKST